MTRELGRYVLGPDNRMRRADTEPDEPERITSATGLAKQWQRAYTASTGQVARVVLRRELGQLKHFVRACGDDYLRAALVMSNAVANWDGFAARARSEAGLRIAPNAPNLGFLLANAQAAMNHLDAAFHVERTGADICTPAPQWKPGQLDAQRRRELLDEVEADG